MPADSPAAVYYAPGAVVAAASPAHVRRRELVAPTARRARLIARVAPRRPPKRAAAPRPLELAVAAGVVVAWHGLRLLLVVKCKEPHAGAHRNTGRRGCAAAMRRALRGGVHLDTDLSDAHDPTVFETEPATDVPVRGSGRRPVDDPKRRRHARRVAMDDGYSLTPLVNRADVNSGGHVLTNAFLWLLECPPAAVAARRSSVHLPGGREDRTSVAESRSPRRSVCRHNCRCRHQHPGRPTTWVLRGSGALTSRPAAPGPPTRLRRCRQRRRGSCRR
jgi:hypothetical protein